MVALYDRLLRIHPSPVVQLNRAVAIAMCDGPFKRVSLDMRSVPPRGSGWVLGLGFRIDDCSLREANRKSAIEIPKSDYPPATAWWY